MITQSKNRWMLYLLPVCLAVNSSVSGAWINVTNNLKGIQGSACGNLCSMNQVPGKDKIIVGTASAGLRATIDGGATWTALGTGAGSDKVNDKPYCITFDPANTDIFWVTGQYGSYGVYKTTDGGVTFHHLGLADGASGQNNVDFTDPLRQTLVVGTIEENPTRVWRSTDGGTTWTNIGATLPAGVNFTYNVTMLNTLTYIVSCAGWGSGTNGIYRTTDGAATWKLVNAQGGREPALIASDSTLYWALEYNRGLIRSTDRGVTWTQPTLGSVISDNSIIELPDNRLVAVGISKRLKVSSDKGAHWTDFLDPLPIQPIAEGRYAVVFNDVRNAFFISKWNCTEPLPDSLVWRYDMSTPVTKPRHSNRSVHGSQPLFRADVSFATASARKDIRLEAYDVRGRMVVAPASVQTRQAAAEGRKAHGILIVKTSRL